MKRLFLAMLIFIGVMGTTLADTTKTIRFGLTAVVVRENLRFLDRWSEYLSGKMGQPVEFVRRRYYREVMDLLETGSIDFAWICGFPFIQKWEPEFIELMTVPVYAGKPPYHSYIIVHKDSPYLTLVDLKGKVFAFSDPGSNSGYLCPKSLLIKRGESIEAFFRQNFFTFNHYETVKAVAEQVADGGAVDSYIWDYLSTFSPEIASQTRIIRKSATFGFPPFVARIGADKNVASRIKATLLSMAGDPEGRKFLEGPMLDGFGEANASLFNSIREMAEQTGKAMPWVTPAQEIELN